MKSVGTFRLFFGLIFAIFLFNWVGAVVFPWLEVGHMQPIQEEGATDITPFDMPGIAHEGEKVYAEEGCVYCHTQQVRAASSGADLARGWGTAKDPDGKDITRRSYPRDYIWQGQSFLGVNRDGGDLSNVGARYKDAASLYTYLYDPTIGTPHSSMPKYQFLFYTRPVQGQASADAVKLPDYDAPPKGMEIVPTEQARTLVAYLLALNKGYHLKPDEAGLPYVPPVPDKGGS
jgi:cytochrome c oxidase cbb3-type subunit 2